MKRSFGDSPSLIKRHYVNENDFLNEQDALPYLLVSLGNWVPVLVLVIDLARCAASQRGLYMSHKGAEMKQWPQWTRGSDVGAPRASRSDGS